MSGTHWKHEAHRSSYLGKIRHNHGLMMLICCAVPLILLFAASYFFGLSSRYTYWAILLLCPLMHIFMMKDMHVSHKDRQ